MKFAHLADCHIGGWREPKLKELGIKAFNEAIDRCIQENTAFVLIAGDLFNTSLPSIDILKDTAAILNKLKENDIGCYIIPGSHDFSPSGKTMLDVLEKAGLVENVFKFEEQDKLKLLFTLDKTNVKICGMLGRKQGLEKESYEILDKEILEKEPGFKIFMFHTALKEFKPEDLEKMQDISVASLPKNFNYYAGGHPHYVFNGEYHNGVVAFPGPLFPNNFKELEELKKGGFYIIDVKDKLELKHINVKFKDVISFDIDVDGLNAIEAESKILKEIKKDVKDKIVTLRVKGVLDSGKVSDINFKEILDKLKDAYVVLKNTNKLTTKEFKELEVKSGNVEDVEKKIIEEHLKEDQFFRI
jgi:hypothetical protein